tara:strand:+ start:3286 stop:3759 length:474 start_codon:yes stop_codon:yes gene_type:complete
MKFLLAFLLTFSAFGAQNAFNADGTVKTTHKKYLIVKNSASGALTVGEFVAPDLTDDNGAAVDFVYQTSARAICMIVDTTCAVGALCKCQTYGFTDVAYFDASVSSATAGGPGFANTAGSVAVESSIAASEYPVGIFLDASSATGAVQFFITLGGGE